MPLAIRKNWKDRSEQAEKVGDKIYTKGRICSECSHLINKFCVPCSFLLLATCSF